MKTKILGLLAAALLAGPMAASAVTLHIAFTQDGLGDAGPDWFGTFEAVGPPSPEGFLLISVFSALIDGATIDEPWVVPHFYDPSANTIFGFFATEPDPGTNGTPVPSLDFQHPGWSSGNCNRDAIGGGILCEPLGTGTYVITRAVVPEPGTLALLGLGLLSLGVVRRRA